MENFDANMLQNADTAISQGESGANINDLHQEGPSAQAKVSSILSS